PPPGCCVAPPGVAPPWWDWSTSCRPAAGAGVFSLLARFNCVELGAVLPPSAGDVPAWVPSPPGAAELDVGAEPLGLSAIRPAMVRPDKAATPAIAATLCPRLFAGRSSSS